MTMCAEDRHRILEAIVSLATRDGLGETVFWEQVEPALMELVANPVAERDLRRFVERINDASVLNTLEDWFARAARERRRDERAARTNAEELVTPVKPSATGLARRVWWPRGSEQLRGPALNLILLPVVTLRTSGRARLRNEVAVRTLLETAPYHRLDNVLTK